MKANEAPERLYLSQERDGDGCYVDLMWHKHPYENMENVEYIRKDAFVEKSCELLARMIWEVTYEDLEGNSVQHYDKIEFIEDFKKHIEV